MGFSRDMQKYVCTKIKTTFNELYHFLQAATWTVIFSPGCFCNIAAMTALRVVPPVAFNIPFSVLQVEIDGVAFPALTLISFIPHKSLTKKLLPSKFQLFRIHVSAGPTGVKFRSG